MQNVNRPARGKLHHSSRNSYRALSIAGPAPAAATRRRPKRRRPSSSASSAAGRMRSRLTSHGGNLDILQILSLAARARLGGHAALRLLPRGDTRRSAAAGPEGTPAPTDRRPPARPPDGTDLHLAPQHRRGPAASIRPTNACAQVEKSDYSLFVAKMLAMALHPGHTRARLGWVTPRHRA
eukprot:COSAG02_NODE_216_length_28610_cov_57.176879_12_plen_181_part_00